MTLRACYEQFGGNYDNTLQRLCSEALIARLLIKFLDDTNYTALLKAMEEKDGKAAFSAIHTLKGVALNLGLSALAEPADKLTEVLRGGWNEAAVDLFPDVAAAYRQTIAAIRTWQPKE